MMIQELKFGGEIFQFRIIPSREKAFNLVKKMVQIAPELSNFKQQMNLDIELNILDDYNDIKIALEKFNCILSKMVGIPKSKIGCYFITNHYNFLKEIPNGWQQVFIGDRIKYPVNIIWEHAESFRKRKLGIIFLLID